MGEVIGFGEIMVEVSVTSPSHAAVGYAGDVFNTLVYLQRLGVASSFATALGDDDPFSPGIRDLIRREGLDDRLVTCVSGRLPGLCAVERDAAGERRFLYWRDGAPMRDFFELADLSVFRDALRQARLLYFSGITLAVIGETGRAAFGPMLTDLAAAGTLVAFDPIYRSELWPSREVAQAATEAVVGSCNIISASEIDVTALYGSTLNEVAADWARCGTLVVSRADDGAIGINGPGSPQRLAPTPRVDAIDTTGSGDAFNAGFLAGYLGGLELDQAVGVGRRVAAHVVKHVGALAPADSMPPMQSMYRV